MEKYFNGIRFVIGVCGGFLVGLFGGWDVLLKTIVIMTVADYLTGWIKAIYNKTLSSEIGFQGVLKKAVMFIVIGVSHAMQTMVGGSIPLREIVLVFYICNEALSILENAAVFIPIPEKLKEVLLQLREKNNKKPLT